MLVKAIHETSSGRYTVELEDGSEIRSTSSVITELYIFTDKFLSDDDIEFFKKQSENSITLEQSIEYISRKQMSVKELYDKLITKGKSEETADYCCSKLQDLGILNDSLYAASLARHYSNRGYGSGKIKNELYRHGINRELYDDALSGISVNEEKIEKIISSKLKDINDKTQIKKITDSLYRRGFSWDEIRSALKKHSENLDLEEY